MILEGAISFGLADTRSFCFCIQIAEAWPTGTVTEI